MSQTTPSAILFCFLIYVYVSGVIGLMCYNCASTKPFSKCESDVRELRKGLRSKFAVNCSDYANLTTPYCSIETHRSNGQIKVLIRECSDGTFSFRTSDRGYAKMKHLNGHTNITICSYVSDIMVCASLCNKDMCNYLESSAKTGSWANPLAAILVVANIWLVHG